MPATPVPALRGAVSALLLALAAAPGLAASPPQWLPIEGRWCPRPGTAPAAVTPPGGPRRDGCVALEVPRTWRQHSMGLQMRPPLPAGRGMWFAFSPPRPARFWMHRTLHPLDMVFVAGGRVVAIETAVPPCPRLPCPSYGPSDPVEGVLELGAGEAGRLGLSPGAPLRVELFRPLGPTAPAPD